MRFGLPDSAMAGIHAVLAAHPEVEQALVYGSRAKGNFKPASDIDLTLLGPALTPQILQDVAEALDDLLLPWIFDLSLLAEIEHEGLVAHIRRVGQVFYTRPTA